MTKEITAKRRKGRSLDYRDNMWGYAFIMPMLVGFLIITVAPV
ncbi:MAG: sugar ABC transporter permease, partial [Lawsonibacter sp.]|nr:sugar ABC transporter permease [Lawsonibacter sp.]